METIYSRTEMLIGQIAVEKLKNSAVAVFGVGGVGSYVAEALARAGVGTIEIIDKDVVSMSNINRQLVALHSTVGVAKVRVMAERISDINPQCNVRGREMFFLPENSQEIDFSAFDYVVDAVDNVTAKIEIISRAKQSLVPVISCLGTGNKTDPKRFEIADIKKTSVCPLARIMRKKLRELGISDVTVLYSREEPICPGGRVPASISFVPSVAGLLIAGHVIGQLT